VYGLVRLLRGIVGADVEIGIHCHDDYGLATANTLAGVRAGADVIDTVVGGLGDKAGIGATEELVMALEVLYDVRTGVRIESLYDLSRTVAEVFGIRYAPNKAVIGDNIVRHEIDSHLNTLLRGYWWAWESMQPALFGRQRSLEWAAGKIRPGRSGSLATLTESRGYDPLSPAWDAFIELLQERVAEQKSLRQAEVEELIEAAYAGEHASR
jgi:isopropylmalate/homocitrate/citramalate synthase